MNRSYADQVSFDVYVQWFDEGAPQGVPIGGLRAAFGPAIVHESDREWTLVYDDLNSSLFLTEKKGSPGLVTGISVNRPCSVTALWSALHRVLGLGHGVLYFPGGGPLVADAASAGHMPEDMRNALGNAIVVSTGDEILAAVRAA